MCSLHSVTDSVVVVMGTTTEYPEYLVVSRKVSWVLGVVVIAVVPRMTTTPSATVYVHVSGCVHHSELSLLYEAK